MRNCIFFVGIIILFCLLSCNQDKHNKMIQLAKEWNGREIIFPEGLEFTLFGKKYVSDSIPNSEYKTDRKLLDEGRSIITATDVNSDEPIIEFKI